MFGDNGLAYQQSAFFSVINNSINWVHEKKTNLTGYFNLKRENEDLQEENRKLKGLTNESFRQVEGDFILKKDTVFNIQYRYQTADVIQGSLHQSNNYFTINRGESDGIVNGMGVISSKGIVGKIVGISDHYSIIECVIANSFTTSVVLSRTGHFGLLQWNGDHQETKLLDIVKNAPLKIGDVAYTREGSTIFPPNIPVGQVSELNVLEGEKFYDITLQLHTDFSKLKKVYVISNLYRNELDQLQSDYYIDE